MGDDKAVVGIVILADGMDELLPLLGTYIGRVQAEQLHRVDLAEVRQFRHEGEEFF